ncbi:MAG TPA: phosphatase PAP2 family protein [Candidatus Dormibacteraeota bacterium]
MVGAPSGFKFSAMLVAAVVYTGLVAFEMLQHGVVATPDFLLPALVPLALVSGRFLAWLRDWVPFIGLLLGWEAMRSVAYRVSPSGVHAGSLHPELLLFGGRLPEVWFQQLLDRGALGHFLDVAAATVDLLHFPAIVAAAFLVWMHGRNAFRTYSIALFATVMIAFVVFLLAPTAPPWYAVEHGWIKGLQHVMIQVMPVHWSGYYQSLDPNPVAADPSLHSALPFIGFLALRRLRSWLAWPMLAWTVGVWFSVVYLGEHYLLDVVAGVGLATLCWGAASALPYARLQTLARSAALAPAGR